MPRRKATTHRPGPRVRRPHSDSSLTPWNTLDDIPLEDDDRFQLNRDKILLEADESGNSDDGGEDEVFPLRHTLSDESSDTTEDEILTPDELTDNRKRVLKTGTKNKKAPSPPPSDKDSDDANEEEEESWGSKKSAYYSTNAQELDSDDEETARLYLEESIRLQAKSRSRLQDIDFGLDDYPLLEKAWAVESVQLQPSGEPMPVDPVECVHTLEKTSPELIALSRDWERVIADLAAIEEKINNSGSELVNSPRLGLLHLYHQTLLCYITTLAFYLSLSTGPAYATNRSKLRTHPILERLVLLREATLELEALNSDDESDDSDAFDDSDIGSDDYSSLLKMDVDELKSLLSDASSLGLAKARSESKAKQAKKPGQRDMNGREKPRLHLEEPTFRPGKTSTAKNASNSAHELQHFGEQTQLEEYDAQDKKEKRKSLRFHTARIDNTQLRRTASRYQRGGDDDLPYPTRRKDIKVTSRVKASEIEDNAVQGKRKLSNVAQVSDEIDEENGYYTLIKKQKIATKEAKKAAYDEQRAIERHGVVDEGSSEGPRSLTRAILANKGLASHRSKSVRNPRVKKRMKYDKAQKKVSSQKAIYKGAPENSKYGGESSGISMRTVKSVRL